MKIEIHPHARQRMKERGATENEIYGTVQFGEQTSASYGRTRFRRNWAYKNEWRGKYYETKQVEVFATHQNGYYLVITVITRFF